MKRPARVPSQLPESMHKRLNAYALAASAAGIGVLALAQPAEARIVYTPSHKDVFNNGHWPFDINGDGRADFYFDWSQSATGVGFGIDFFAEEKWNRIVGYYGGGCSPLRAGFRIGPRAPNQAWCLMFGTNFSGGPDWGPWANHGKGFKNRYLGLKFYVNGKAHYGWARLTILHKNTFAVMTGYAYETIPNKPIIAGKTHGRDEATLGRLAQGATSVRQKQ